MQDIKVGNWVKINKDLRVGMQKETTEYQVGKIFENGDLWVLTPQFAQPWGYDGERVPREFVTHVRES